MVERLEDAAAEPEASHGGRGATDSGSRSSGSTASRNNDAKTGIIASVHGAIHTGTEYHHRSIPGVDHAIFTSDIRAAIPQDKSGGQRGLAHS